ncbi:MAG: metallophosphoesterase, partial [Lutibacter sp.]|nr:metallophosphoesterase [Lutibacter sp.]
MVRWLIFIAIVLFIDFYAFQGVKTVTKNKWFLVGYWLVSMAVLMYLIFSVSTMDRSKGFSQAEMLSFGLFIMVSTPKLIAFLVLFGEDVFRIFKGIYQYLFQSEATAFLPERRILVSKLALSLAAIPFASVLYGMMRGKYNYQVIEHTLFFDDLPDAFDGYKITHLSDIHSGSFDDAEKIAHGMDLINQQKSDVILFTGDLVNNLAEEMDPWISHFSMLKARDGKFSVLGNHDYGEYIQWNSAKEKEVNFQAVKDIHPK